MPAKLEILVAFGEAVREVRKSRKLSQEQLADKAGLHRTYIGMIERGEKNLTLSNIAKIAKAFGISMSEFFNKIPS